MPPLNPRNGFRDARAAVAEWFARPVEILLRYRHIVKFILYLVIFVSANWFAYFVRFDFSVPRQYFPVIRDTIPLLLAAKALGFLAFGLFSGWWRFVSIRDIFPISAGCTLGSGLFAGAVYYLYGPFYVPRSIYFLDWGNTLLLVLGIRYLVRAGRETFGRIRMGAERRALIVGAGSAGG
jgi:FlaA1/EpsC-like NDP-sugar epimerase